MENQRVFLRSVFLLLAAFSSALAENLQVSVADGDKITFDLNPPASAGITRLVWKHEDNVLGDWTDGEFSYFGTFKGRTTIDSTTGSLEIKNATESDSGLYEVEVNNEIQTQRYDVKVIRKVPKHKVLISPVGCSPSVSQCALLCEAKTDESEAVTHSWREEGGDWKKENLFDIRMEGMVCRLWNPVSDETSEPKRNPFFKKPLVPGNYGNVGLGVALGVLAVVALVACWKRDTIMRGIDRFAGNCGGPNGDGQKEPDPESLLTKSGEQHPQSDRTATGHAHQLT